MKTVKAVFVMRYLKLSTVARLQLLNSYLS